MKFRHIVVIILIAFFIGAAGSIVVGRVLIPYLATMNGWGALNKWATSSPIVINRKEEVHFNEGVNIIDLIRQANNVAVSVYTTDPNPSFLGNGTIMTSDGLIFTVRSVTGDRSQVNVILNNGSVYKGLVRATDPKSDLVAMTIEATGLSVVEFADSVRLSAGQKILAVGESNNPFDHSFTSGFVINNVLNTINSIGVNWSTEILSDKFETDAWINQTRFAGSPIVNLEGRLVAMATGNNIQNMIVTENLQTALSSYLTTNKIVRPVLGVTYMNLSESQAKLQGLNRAGVRVVATDKFSPASAQLLPGDLIFQVDGLEIVGKSFGMVVNQHPVGEIKFKLLRDGKEIEIILNLTQTK